MPKAWPIVFWTKFVSSETIKIKSTFYYWTGRTELKFFLKNGVRLILSLIYIAKRRGNFFTVLAFDSFDDIIQTLFIYLHFFYF